MGTSAQAPYSRAIMQIMILYTTVASFAEAEQLAQNALREKLATCVNIIPHGRSLYIWEQRIEQTEEHYLLFKTTAALLPTLQEWVLQHHPYEIPAILTWTVNTSEAFGKYVLQQTL
jgi:periplasmic divalent cation tolerance protein